MPQVTRAMRALLISALILPFITAEARAQQRTGQPAGRMDPAQMTAMMANWPTASREAAMFMTNKYGPPAAMTPDMVVWGQSGPWKRTIVFAKEYPHAFPMPHMDVMQQWVDYKAPSEMYDDLVMYDGSVVLERTSGEMSARCDREGANFLAINLADEIVRGERSVEEARTMYGEQMMKVKAKQSAPYTEKLMFTPKTNTGDPDKTP